MKSNYGALAGALSLVCVTGAQAQQVVSAATVATPVPPAQAVFLGDPTPNVLRAGTPIALRMSQELTTLKKKLRTGQRFQMEVAEAVSVNGQVVIPAGSPAVGEVTQVRNKGMWGKSGYIGAQAIFVRANGRQIRLTGQFDDKGVTGTAGVVGAIALVPIAGFFMTGTSARIPMGSGVKAFIDEDITVAFAPTAAPMMVPSAAAPVIVPAAPTTTAISPSGTAQ
jgi:hypothetical protein